MRFIRPLLVAFALAVALGCRPAPSTAPARETPAALPSVASGDAKEQFRQFVSENAQDPAGFEIVSWGEEKGGSRNARFRCKLIALTQGGTYLPGVHERGGDPVMLDDAQIAYSSDGKIKNVHLVKCRTFWGAKAD